MANLDLATYGPRSNFAMLNLDLGPKFLTEQIFRHRALQSTSKSTEVSTSSLYHHQKFHQCQELVF